MIAFSLFFNEKSNKDFVGLQIHKKFFNLIYLKVKIEHFSIINKLIYKYLKTKGEVMKIS